MKRLLMGLTKDGIRTVTIYPVGTILIYLIESFAEQDERVANLERKVEELILRPYKEAKRWIDRADKASSTKKKNECLEKAIEALFGFIDTSLADYPLLPIQGCLYIGLCFDELGDRELANQHDEETEKRFSEKYPG